MRHTRTAIAITGRITAFVLLLLTSRPFLKLEILTPRTSFLKWIMLRNGLNAGLNPHFLTGLQTGTLDALLLNAMIKLFPTHTS